MLRGKEIIFEYNERYSQSWEKLQAFNQEARTDMQFYLGKQYSPQEQQHLAENEREMITNNKILRAINLVTGEQRLNRLGSAFLAINNNIMEEVETADQLSNAVQFVLQKQYGYFHISDCFQGALISGINFSEMYFDYTYDTDDGDIKFLRIPQNAMMWDPYFQNFDLSDCNYIMRRKYISHATAIALLPDRYKDIKKIKGDKRDGKFPNIPFESNPNGQQLLAYDEFWERDTEQLFTAVNMKFNIRKKFPRGTTRKQAQKQIDAENKKSGFEVYKLVGKDRPVVNLYIMIEGEVMYEGKEPNNIDDYPFTPFIAYYTPEYDEYELNLQSFIRAARDPQKELNKRISKTLDFIDRRIYGGHYAKLSKLIDEDDLYNSGNHGNIGLVDEAVIGQDIAPIQYPDVPQSFFQMQNVFDENIMSVLNLNDAAFGQQQKGDQSGFKTMLQQSSAMMGLQPLTDNLNRSQSILTFKLGKMVQNWSEKKVERVTGKPPATMFYDRDFSRFDAVTISTVLTEHQKKLNFMQILELKQMGVNSITGSMLAKRAPIQDQGEFLKEIEANEQAAAQQAQVQMQMQLEKDKLAAELVRSQTIENKSDTVRESARAVADIALSEQHIAAATASRANAALDMTKAANEIIDMKSERFMSAIQFLMDLQDRAKAENQQALMIDKDIVDNTVAKVNQENVQQTVGV